MKHVNEDQLWEAVEYYRENAFGYDGVDDYVEADFWFVEDPSEREFIANFIRENI